MGNEEEFSPVIAKEAQNHIMANCNRVHFIGIGGVGMSGLARICLEHGMTVSGTDISENDNTRMLKSLGALISFGHQASNIPPDAGKVVVSSAITRDNEELSEARRLQIPIFHRSDLLAELFLDARSGIAVAGCHGKTTVTSMIATMLQDAGVDPTCVVGGYVASINGNSRCGKSGVFVAEADESDATFLKYFPQSGVITNIDNDHMDHYSNLESIVKAFEVFASHVEPGGSIYLCADDPIARNIALPEGRRILTYGIDNPAYLMAEDVKLLPFGSEFKLTIGGINRGIFRLKVPGKHNVLNVLPVIGLGLDLGVSMEMIQKGLLSFHGAGRRFEVKGTWEGVTVIDDYGHHPNEIKATLSAARSLGAKRILVVFQPHRYSRTQFLSREFGRCFGDCDRLFLTDIYAASEKPIPGVSSRMILDHMPVAQRHKTRYVRNLGDIPFQVLQTVEPGDVVFTIGAGSVTSLGNEIIEAMKTRSFKAESLKAHPAV